MSHQLGWSSTQYLSGTTGGLYVAFPNVFTTVPTGLDVLDAEVEWIYGCSPGPIGSKSIMIVERLAQGGASASSLYQVNPSATPPDTRRVVVELDRATLLAGYCGPNANYGGEITFIWNRGKANEIRCKGYISDINLHLGCTNSNSANHNVDANYDDGSCTSC